MPNTFRYNDPDGTPVLRTDYSEPPRPVVVTDVKHEYKPMEPGEALRWSLVAASPFVLGAALINVIGGLSRLMVDSPLTHHAAFAAITLPAPWLLAGTVFVGMLSRFVVLRLQYERGMVARYAPRPAEDEDIEDDETDDAPRISDAPTPSDKLYDKCVAVLTYAFKRGGVAPVPRTTRNGTASLILATGGTLDGNDYPAVATLLRDRYGLMKGGDGKPWALATGWPDLDALLDAFDATFDRRALGLDS